MFRAAEVLDLSLFIGIKSFSHHGYRRIALEPQCAGMVELVDAADSKSAGGNPLRVQVSLSVPEKLKGLQKCRPFFRLQSVYRCVPPYTVGHRSRPPIHPGNASLRYVTLNVLSPQGLCATFALPRQGTAFSLGLWPWLCPRRAQVEHHEGLHRVTTDPHGICVADCSSGRHVAEPVSITGMGTRLSC